MKAIQTTDQLKTEISEHYLKDFKKELGWIKSLALLPIEKKVKKILTGQTELPQKFDEVEEFGRWKDVIDFVSPKTAQEIFDFMKAKRLEIEKRKTKEELENLKAEILGGKPVASTSVQSAENDQNLETITNPATVTDSANAANQETTITQTPEAYKNQDSASGAVSENVSEATSQANSQAEKSERDARVVGAGTSVVGMAGVRGAGKAVEKLHAQTLSKNLNPEQMKSSIDAAVQTLKKQKQALGNRLTTKQVKNLDSHIAKLQKGVAEADAEAFALIKSRDQLNGKLPKSLLTASGLDVKTLTKIEGISIEIAGKSVDEIKLLLKNKNISNVSDEVIIALSKAASPQEVKSMAKLLKHGSKLNRVIQTLSGMMLIDVACLGLDVRMYLETEKEAELVAKVNQLRAQNIHNKAITQLGIGVASVALELLLACTVAGSAGGPVGMAIGLGIGAVSAAASIGVDSLYFDVKDFYLQNKEDFLRQKTSRLQQTILQGIHNKKEGNLTLNETIGAPDQAQKEQSLQDACFSLCFLQEMEEGEFSSYEPFYRYLQSGESKENFLATLDANEKADFEAKRAQMESKIKVRLSFFEKQFAKNEVISALKAGGGMRYLLDLISQSRAYAELSGQGKRDEKLSFQQNMDSYKAEFFAEFPAEKVGKLAKIEQEQPELFEEMLVMVDLSSLQREGAEGAENYDQNLKLLQKTKERIQLSRPLFAKMHLEIPDTNKNMKFLENLLEADFDLSKVQYPTASAESVKALVELQEERRGNLNLSADPLQNTLWRMARELYGYRGTNEKAELMSFFSEGEGNVHGIYFKADRMVNNDWAIDAKVNKRALKATYQDEQEVAKAVNAFVTSNFETPGSDPYAPPRKKSIIDTATENIDKHLQKEFEDQFRKFLTEELSYRTQAKQNEIKSQISDFVSKHAQEGEYLELPYYLLVQAQRAGLGDLQRQFFTRKNGKLTILGFKSELTQASKLGFEQEYFTPRREKLSSGEQYRADRVEASARPLFELLTHESAMSKASELDIPREVQVLVAEKYKEREQFKSDLLYADATQASTQLVRFQEFQQYFEQLYRGILLRLSTFKVSNDIDEFGLFESAQSAGAAKLFDQTGKLSEQPESGFHILNKAEVKSFYADMLKSQKIGSQTLDQLWTSEKKEDRELAHQASNLMITMILESMILRRKADGSSKEADIGDEKFTPVQQAALRSKITAEFAKLKSVANFDSAEIEALMQGETKIHSLTPEKKETVSQISPLQRLIEETRSHITWQGKRGNITYDPERGELVSWGQKLKLIENSGKYYLENFEIGLSIKDALWLANFANWMRSNYQGKQVAFEVDLANMNGRFGFLPSFKKTWVVDGKMLIARGDLENYLSVGRDDTMMHKMTTRLNSVLH